MDERTKQILEKEQQTLQNLCSEEKLSHYKVHVGKGNNSVLVRSLFKQRYWWLQHDKEEPDRVNFLWTQCRKGDIMKTIKCKFVNSKEQTSPKKRKRTNSVQQSLVL